MKLICVNRVAETSGISDYKDITIGKVYDELSSTTKISARYYCIMGDGGRKWYYPKSNFITLEEWRTKQIDSVL